MAKQHVGVIGATSFVGESLLALLAEEHWRVSAFSRRAANPPAGNVSWRQLPPPALSEEHERIPVWICAAPVWVLPEHFELLDTHHARRVVALSSTSRFTKNDSSDPQEQMLAQRLGEAEISIRAWAQDKGIEWIILRPTLIYGRGRDRNICEIARFIRRFGFFPVFGKAQGLRQPVHVDDVAQACVAALETESAANRDYNISGAETLSYRAMVCRIFAALGRQPRLLAVPLRVFRLATVCLRLLPRYRTWSTAMAQRMNQDLVFDHASAARDLQFAPRGFVLTNDDLPEN